jgi:hypothetical protein
VSSTVAWLRRIPTPLAIAAAWTSIAALAAGQGLARAIALGLTEPLSRVAIYLAPLPFWALATPVVFRAAARYPLRGLGWPGRLAGWTAAFAVFFVGTNLLLRAHLLARGWPAFGRDLALGLSEYVVPAALAFTALIAIGHALARSRSEAAGDDIPEDASSSPPATNRDLVISDRVGTERIALSAILWIQAEDNYVLIHTPERTHAARERLGALATRLDPTQFLRVHRSAIVHRAAVRSVRPLTHGDYEIELAGGAVVRGSRSRRRALELLRS